MDLIDGAIQKKSKAPTSLTFKPNPTKKSQARPNAPGPGKIATDVPVSEMPTAAPSAVPAMLGQPAMQPKSSEQAAKIIVQSHQETTQNAGVEARSRVRFAVSSLEELTKAPGAPLALSREAAHEAPAQSSKEHAAVSSLPPQIKSKGRKKEMSQVTTLPLAVPLVSDSALNVARSMSGINGWKQLLRGMRESLPDIKPQRSAARKRARGSKPTIDVPPDGAAPAVVSRRRRRPKTKAIQEEEEEEEHEEEAFEERVPVKRQRKTKGKPTINSHMSAAGLAFARMPLVDEDEDVDVESWSIRQIIAKGQMWDKKKMNAAKKAAKESQAALGGEGEGAASLNAAGPSTSDAAALVPSSLPSTSAPAASSLGPRLQVINGQIVVDAASLTIQAQRPDDSSNYTRVEEGNRLINSHSYMKRQPGERWGKEETDLFYRALRHFGTDFTLIAQLFPKRDRKHIKNKYNKEIKILPGKVNDALIGRGKNPEETRELYNVILSNQRNATQQIEQAAS